MECPLTLVQNSSYTQSSRPYIQCPLSPAPPVLGELQCGKMGICLVVKREFGYFCLEVVEERTVVLGAGGRTKGDTVGVERDVEQAL